MPHIEGLVEIIETLNKLENTESIVGGIELGCAAVERDAKKKAPKNTGELKRSITSKVENEGRQVVGKVFTPLEYAPYVEYGTGLFAEKGGRKDVPWNYKDDKGEWHSTRGMQPQPFMRPALQENRERIMNYIKAGVNLND